MKRLNNITITIAAGFILIFMAPAGSFGSPASTGNEIVQDGDTLNAGKIIKINPFWLDIIAPSTGVQFYRDGIVFLANTRSESKMPESHTSFGKVETYYASLDDTLSGNHVLFSSSVPWEVPTDAMTFNKDYSVMYYTKLPTGRESEKIYQAKYQSLKNGKREWISDTKPLSFCNDKSVYTNPALSADGEKIIFASNRKESIGGLDLFISYKEGESWSEPINLGNLINTQGNETSPYLDQSNNLFFSSDGIKGYGGYDIYMCRYNGRGWDKPLNLTRIVNTPDDELAFTLDPINAKSAFYSSRNTKGNKQVRLYRITFRDQYASNRLGSISNAVRYIAQAGYVPAEETQFIAEKPAEQVTREKDTVKEKFQEPALPAVVEKPVAEPKAETQLPAVKSQNPPVTAEVAGAPSSGSDEIVYRVQFMSLSKPKGSFDLKVGGKSYKTFEYFYNGVYRSCAGEFNSPAAAQSLLNQMKREGYPDAFIVAFKNNERITGTLQAAAKVQENAVTEKPQVIAQPGEPVQKQAGTELTKSDALIYRVQYATSSNPGGVREVTIEGKTYKTFEYLYNGAYRLCAGEFPDRGSALALQSAMRRGQYKDAFIVAFKNGIRITDPASIK
ncbi:MAG TPA: hypothetical protein PLX08_13680 [Bacteroidales bacterium]|jgi:hypothetical protein|nr:hypothetical protein [Bacteroidales bacterium]